MVEHIIQNDILPYRFEIGIDSVYRKKYSINALPKLIIFKSGK